MAVSEKEVYKEAQELFLRRLSSLIKRMVKINEMDFIS